MTMERKRQKEQEKLQRAVSLELAKSYCQNNGLSFEKLKGQEFYWIYGEAIFAQPSGVEPKGLTNDRETMPLPTLIIKLDNDELKIEQTEYTKKYLM